MKEKIIKLLKSRTFWVALVAFLVNGLQAIKQYLPTSWLVFVDAVLLVLTSYFKVNPSQTY